MNAISKTSKIALITMVLAAAATGCNRQSPDANQSSSAAGTTGSTSSDTSGTTGSLASRSGTTDNADTSRSASTDNSGSSSGGSYGTSSSSDTVGSSSSGGSTTAGTSGTGTTVGTVIDDSVITTKVKSALLGDSDIKSLDISVKTDKGEVMLSGFVKNQAQIERAVKIASGVEGVKGVQNKMSVKG